MKGFIDVHCHILPGVDDGSRSMRMTEEMLAIAWKEGIRTMIATPHYHIGRSKTEQSVIQEQYDKVKKMAGEKFPGLRILLGNELYYCHDAINLLESGRVRTMAESLYVLTEFMPDTEFSYIKEAVNELVSNGYRPLIAHIERYECIAKKPALAEELVDVGAYIQVNAMSVTGDNGRVCKRCVKKLMKLDLVHTIGTDAHSNGRRTPRLQECAAYLTKKFGEEYAANLMIHNPQRIINNEYI